MAVSFGQGISFFEGSWSEAKSKAQKEDKIIFVDAYAVWCGPCKRMAKNVFTHPEVGAFMNTHFVNLKIDMEKDMGRSFGQDYPVRAYPTLFFIDSEGEVLKKVVGGKDVSSFLALAKAVYESFDRSGEFAELYDQGNRDYQLVLDYVKALNNASKPSQRIANDFIRKHADGISEDQKAEFLFEAVTSVDSRLFDKFLNHKSRLEELKGSELVNEKIEEACWNTIETAIAFESTALLDEAKSKASIHLNEANADFIYRADYEYAKATADVQNLPGSAIALAQSVYKKDAEKLYELCNELLQYKSLDSSVLNTSEKLAEMAAKEGKSPEYLMVYSRILLENGKGKKAMKQAEKALKLVPENSNMAKEIGEFISDIKAE